MIQRTSTLVDRKSTELNEREHSSKIVHAEGMNGISKTRENEKSVNITKLRMGKKKQ